MSPAGFQPTKVRGSRLVAKLSTGKTLRPPARSIGAPPRLSFGLTGLSIRRVSVRVSAPAWILVVRLLSAAAAVPLAERTAPAGGIVLFPAERELKARAVEWLTVPSGSAAVTTTS